MSLQTHHLGRTDRGACRIYPLDLCFKAGQLCVIAGPNGSGKSTLLQLLSGSLAPSHGRVSLDGMDLVRWDRRALAQRRAFLEQAIPARLPFVVEDVVRLGCSPHPHHDDHAMVESALQAVELASLRHQSYNRLSGGQQARVQLARTLAQLGAGLGPSVYLLDEPTASFDPHWQHRCLQLLRSRARQGWCVICVLHDLNLASRYADRIVLLDQGRLALDGDSRTVLEDRRLDQVYGLDFQRLQNDQRIFLHA